MKTLRSTLAILAVSLLTFSCTAESVSDSTADTNSRPAYDTGGDDDVVEETEKDDE